ncbi:hypothetical protein Tco_1351423 [Tanacetum coccineum]
MSTALRLLVYSADPSNLKEPHHQAANSSKLQEKHQQVYINDVEDTCVWSMGTHGVFLAKDSRCIIDSKLLPSLAPSTLWDKNIP